MENDLISRSALLKEMRVSGKAAYMVVQDAPAVDAVPVVRCKDCKYFRQKVSCGGFCKCGEVNGGQPHMRVNEDFCSYGERRADGGN